MKTIYDKAYFIAKFEAIPEDKWCSGTADDGEGGHCALGHCCDDRGMPTLEHKELIRLFPNQSPGLFLIPALINDGKYASYQQPTPKQRILAALHDLP